MPGHDVQEEIHLAVRVMNVSSNLEEKMKLGIRIGPFVVVVD